MAPEKARIHRQTDRRELPTREYSHGGGPGQQDTRDVGELILTGFIFLFGGAVLLLSRSDQPLTFTAAFGFLGIPALLMFAFHSYACRWQPEEFRKPRNLRITAFTVLLVALICRLFLILAHTIHASLSSIPLSSLEYSLPVGLSGALFCVIFNPRLAFAGSLGTIILVSFFSTDPFSFFLVSFAGSMMGISSLIEHEERTSFLKAGGLIAVANMTTILVLAFLRPRTMDLPYDLICGAVNGLLVGILALGLLPSLESLFDITTNFKLLELSNLHQPILRQLILVAPGTYHHSIVLGTLAEAAAEAVGANSLLVRVSAYYHDIGKIKKPAYFIENQMEALNRHDKLSPSMSSLIVTSHVKDGVELARESKLPAPIIDIIRQHHGTSLITFFYQKAKDAENTRLAEVREEEYRYTGPKPQTKEAAIVMLADAVEAASKTLTDPTPARVQGMVERIINNIFVDGQLEECDLTLRDLHQIAKAFVRILTGIFHHRVDYPGFNFEDWGDKRGDNGDFGQKSAKEDKGRSKSAKRGYEEDIKRLGV